jgi:hypothetical protein
MLPRNINSFESDCAAGHWKGKSDIAIDTFIECIAVSLQHLLHLFLHHLSLEKVALDLHSYNLRFGAMRFTNLSNHVAAELVFSCFSSLLSLRSYAKKISALSVKLINMRLTILLDDYNKGGKRNYDYEGSQHKVC